MKSYRYLDDIATADAAFEACGTTLEELFEAAAEATVNVMVENPADIVPRKSIAVKLSRQSPDMLLFAFLGEIVYHKDAGLFLAGSAAITVTAGIDEYRLEGTLNGETIDRYRHRMIVDVKAVTMHRLSVEKTGDGWRATVVLDI